MRPFFSYYGAKYTVAAHLGPPRRDLVIEPFAGSMAYATRWNAPRVIGYDLNEDIVALWGWLIHASEADVRRIPDAFESIDEVMALPRGASLLVRFWTSKGRAEAAKTLSSWYFAYRDAGDARVWGPAVKARILAQQPFIRAWDVRHGSYADAPDVVAHWHVDPPYSGNPGRRYAHSEVDYAALAAWCRARRGTVDVCENLGATWLPFEELCAVVSTRGRFSGHRSIEAVCRLESAPVPVRRES